MVDDGISNPTDNRPFQDVLASRVSRRGVMAGGLATAAGFFVLNDVAGAIEGDSAGGSAASKDGGGSGGPLVGFSPVAVADGNGPMPAISSDYEWAVLNSWGDPIRPAKGPGFVYPPTSAAAAEEQIGIGHDGMWFFPFNGKKWQGNRGALCLNHEFGRTSHVLGKDAPESLEDVRIMQAVHGVSVLVLKRKKNGRMYGKGGRKGPWKVAGGKRSRRITANTPVEYSGPVAGSPLLDNKAGNGPAGTLNNCANGYTPWGTYLTCEENFNGYFGDSTYNPDTETGTWQPTPEQERYGFAPTGFGYGWERFDPRFDLSNPDHANEAHRFGWIVEIDPKRPKSTPVKRTALGRFKHEGIALAEGEDRRIVGYMGDDERFDYIYKFVSADNWKKMRKAGTSPLDVGKLYAAKFNDDGTGEWLELSMDNPDVASGFTSEEEILLFARMAADLAGATPMDRPEWTTVGPDGHVYCTLTNNTRREAPDPANPFVPNPDGHIIRWKDSDNHLGLDFTWEILLVAGETTGTEDSFSAPDGIWADPDGRLFIQTDGGQNDGLNNQMLVFDPASRDLRRLYTGVTGDECTGVAVSPDRKTMFINTQHPGNGDPELTNFPKAPNGWSVPRDSTLMIWRKDGGIVGS